ncbi:LysR family transcriptional regulator, mexEF-oprN operon transcriptional activator [Pseudomonas helmanticensis]|uniref:LysR family transcriptional regulator, mexEF-oprN operon transcriptional activator n=1 Tax=Pseudomonas helmanticensis TaxID=1471381 RepID=A0ACD2UDS0_9PSED|nr:LysR family transcriptional regulator [Pseudomonas helmanticensis]SMQ30366.1 LysR family transcriptional regulator, mexEF-oprN operon transcriptional activator [Pseudomonas helmanticensis]
MNRNDLRKIDFSLLIIFETLMEEHSLTRTGEKLFLCQSAISASLNRLRQLFDDPLFVRLGRTMEPTSRAIEILQNLTPAIDKMAVALHNVSDFDPKTSSSVFKIGLSDDVEYSLLPCLLRQLRQEAPQISFAVHRTDHSVIADQLSSGEISLGVSNSRDLPANAKRKFLRNIRPTVLSADSQMQPLDLDEYCKRPHVSISLSGEMTDHVDRALGSLGRQRQVVLAVPQYSALKALIEHSDLVAVVPDYVAKAMLRQGGLRMDPVPVTLPSADLSLSWSAMLDNDAGERWLRSRVTHHLCEKRATPGEISPNTQAA